MKTLKIIQLVMWLLIIAALVTALVLFAAGKVNISNFIKTGKQIELLSQTQKTSGIKGINFDLNSADVIIKPSATDEISIIYRGPESLKDDPDITVTVEGDQLTVRQDSFSPVFFFNFGSLTARTLEISLPQSYAGDLDMKNSSGELTVSGKYQLSSLKSQLSSGNINMEDISCTDFSAKSSSGNITLGTVKAQTLTISMTSGHLKAQSLSGDGSISTMSGDIKIDSLTGNNQVSMTSGNISVSSFSGSGSFKCSSGNIVVAIAEASGDIAAKTTSGNIDIRLGVQTAFLIEANCTSGNVSANFPLSFSDNKNHADGQFGSSKQYNLSARTTSGNIHLAS